jgi:hypothetical protein
LNNYLPFVIAMLEQSAVGRPVGLPGTTEQALKTLSEQTA